MWNDSDDLIWCKWAHCVNQDKPLKYPSKFGSKNWLPSDVTWSGLGEYPTTPRIHCDSRPLYPFGVGCHKDVTVYTQGASITRLDDPLGLLPCCRPDPDAECGILMEDDGFILGEDWYPILLERCPDACDILMEEDASPMLSEAEENLILEMCGE